MTPKESPKPDSIESGDHPDEPSESLVGRLFAYRARAIDQLTPVLVLKEGTKKPPRVLIRFEDPAMEGREEWVPPGRLKVAWDQVDASRADEARWNAVNALAPRGSSPEEEAAEEAAKLLIPDEVGVLWRGYLRVHDVQALAEIAGVDEDFIASHPQGFADDDDSLIVPWPLALEIVKKAITRDSDRVLEPLTQDEARARYEAIHGHLFEPPGDRVDSFRPRTASDTTQSPHMALRSGPSCLRCRSVRPVGPVELGTACSDPPQHFNLACIQPHGSCPPVCTWSCYTVIVMATGRALACSRASTRVDQPYCTHVVLIGTSMTSRATTTSSLMM